MLASGTSQRPPAGSGAWPALTALDLHAAGGRNGKGGAQVFWWFVYQHSGRAGCASTHSARARLWRPRVGRKTREADHVRRHSIRLHHHRRGQRRLRAGQPAERRSQDQSAAAGSWRRRPPSAQPEAVLVQHDGPDTHRVRQDAERSQGQLALRDGRGRRIGRAQAQVAQGQGAGRLVLDQRPALYPRPGGRL